MSERSGAQQWSSRRLDPSDTPTTPPSAHPFCRVMPGARVRNLRKSLVPGAWLLAR